MSFWIVWEALILKAAIHFGPEGAFGLSLGYLLRLQPPFGTNLKLCFQPTIYRYIYGVHFTSLNFT